MTYILCVRVEDKLLKKIFFLKKNDREKTCLLNLLMVYGNWVSYVRK